MFKQRTTNSTGHQRADDRSPRGSAQDTQLRTEKLTRQFDPSIHTTPITTSTKGIGLLFKVNSRLTGIDPSNLKSQSTHPIN